MPGGDVRAVGFETNDFSESTSTNGTPEIVTSPVHMGSYAGKFNAADEECRSTVTATDKIWLRGYVRITSLPAAGKAAGVLQIWGNSGATFIAQVKFARDPGGLLEIWLDGRYPTTWVEYRTNWETDRWYCLELAFYKHATQGYYKVYLDGSLIINKPNLNTSGSPQADQIRYGACALDHTNTIYVDDVVSNNLYYIGTHEEWTTGLENDFADFDSQVGTPAISELKRHCGVKSMECAVSQYGNVGAQVDLGHHKEVYVALAVQFDAMPASGCYIDFLRINRGVGNDLLRLLVYNDAGTVKWGFRYRSSGSLTTVYSTTATNPSALTWYIVRARVRCTYADGAAVGIYQMWVDSTELSDIAQSSKDTDYTGQTILYAVATTDDPLGAIVYYDDLVWDSLNPGTHPAGSEDVPTLTEPSEGTPPMGVGAVQFFLNLKQVPLISFQLEHDREGQGVLVLPFDMPIVKTDVVHLDVEGSRVLQGKVVKVEADIKEGLRVAHVQTKTARLFTKHVLAPTHQIYTGLDAGAIVKDLIDYYFNGLFSSALVNTSTGITIPEIDGLERSIGDMITELDRRAGTFVEVQNDGKVLYELLGAIHSGIRLSPEDILDIQSEDLGDKIATVIVRGDGVQGSAGSGIPELVETDRRVKTEEEAQELAQAIYERYGGDSPPRRTTVLTRRFFNLRRGRSMTLHYPREGYDESEVTVQKVSWRMAAGQVQTVIVIGEEEPTLEWAFRELMRRIEQTHTTHQISSHSGGSAAVQDPVLTYETLLNLGAGSETAYDSTANTTLRTGTCSSPTSSLTSLAYVETVIHRTAGGTSADSRINLEDSGGTVYHSWNCRPEASTVDWTLTAMLPVNFSGKTLYIKGRCISGGSATVTATLKVKQFLQHGHSVTQSLDHTHD